MSAIDFLLLGLPELSEAELAALGGGYGEPNLPGPGTPPIPPGGAGHYGEDYFRPRPRPGYGN